MGLWDKIKSIFIKKEQPKLLSDGNNKEPQAQENYVRKRISRPSTSQKLALLLSTGVLVLPLAACKSNVETDKKPITEVSLCDTSDIRLSKYIEEYITAFESGDISDSTEMYAYYKELYELLKQEPISETDGISENTTYNFNKELMNYDTFEEESGSYYANGELIKDINFSSVNVKTLYGNIEIQNNDEYYTIINKASDNSIETIIKYNLDGSWEISENKNGENEIYKFNNEGLLTTSEIEDETKKVYVDGNINVYNNYKFTFNENTRLIEERKPDGSYIIYDSGRIDETRFNRYSDYSKYFDKIIYYYGKNDKINQIKAYNTWEYNDNRRGEGEVIIFPNGDYYEYNKYFDEDDNIYRNEKIERKYDKSRTEINETVDENGEKIVTICTWEDDVHTSSGAIDITYYSINNKVLKERKNGIIYEYSSEDGLFFRAYKVQDDGEMYYRKDGTKLRFEGKDGTRIGYYENENIEYIENDKTFTRYHKDYPKVISYMSNKTDEDITVEINGKKYKLSETGYVKCFENGDIQEYYYDENNGYQKYESGNCVYKEKGITTTKDSNENILNISNNTTRTEFYDYNQNFISSIQNKSEEEITVEANGKEFVLGENGLVSFFEDGSTKRYKYDDNKIIEYTTYGTHKIFEDGKWTSYNKDNEIVWIGNNVNGYGGLNGFYTEYYDYENNLIKIKKENGITTTYSYNQDITSLENNNKDGITVTINDIYGNTYDLKDGDFVSFYTTGNIAYIKQEDIFKKYYRNDNEDYYYIKNESDNTYTFYHNDEVLYTTNNPDSFEIKYKDGAQRVVLEDGTIVDPDIEEIIETTEMTPEEEAHSNNLEDCEER